MKVKTQVQNELTLKQATECLRKVIFSDEYKKFARKSPNFFTRTSKLVFTAVIAMMINLVRSTTTTAIDKYLDIFNPNITISQQAFSQARQKIHWEACKHLSDKLVEAYYSQGYRTWHGYRVFIIDGTKIQLPSDSNLKANFGTFGNKNTSPTAQCSILYDALNNIIIFSYIEPISVGERQLAERHIDDLKKMDPFGLILIIFDRGYPSFDLLNYCNNNNITFIMRTRTKFNNEIDRMHLGCYNFILRKKGIELKVRVIKIKLSSD
jgi:hypothetical protein